jgi:hypothetical protein
MGLGMSKKVLQSFTPRWVSILLFICKARHKLFQTVERGVGFSQDLRGMGWIHRRESKQ